MLEDIKISTTYSGIKKTQDNEDDLLLIELEKKSATQSREAASSALGGPWRWSSRTACQVVPHCRFIEHRCNFPTWLVKMLCSELCVCRADLKVPTNPKESAAAASDDCPCQPALLRIVLLIDNKGGA